MDVRLPDGTVVKNVPDGTTRAELTEKLRANGYDTAKLSAAATVPAKQKIANDEITKGALGVEATPAELIAANPIVQTLTAAAKPVLGAAALVEGLWGGTSNVDRIKQLDEMQKRGRQALNIGDASSASSDIVGAIMSPVGLGATKLTPAASYIGKVAQGAGVGAIAGELSGSGTPIADATMDAAIGAAIPGVGIPAVKVANAGYHALIEPWMNPAAIKGRAFLEAAGDKADEIIALLRQNRQLVPGAEPTAGEVAAPAGSTGFSALQQSASTVRGVADQYVARTDAQNAARLAAVRSVGQDEAALNAAKATRAENAAEAYGAVRGDKITPSSQTAVMDGAIADREASRIRALQEQGKFSTTAAQQDTLANSFSPVPGMPRVSERVSPNLERVTEARGAATDAATIVAERAKEKAFLEATMRNLQDTVGLEDKSLQFFLRRPSMQAAVKDAIKGAQETGAYFPDSAKKPFSVENLQRIKQSLDDVLKDPATFGLKGTEQKEIKATRDAFVNWLSNKSPGWKDARLQYLVDSRPINQMEIGQYLERKLVPALSEDAKQRSGMYANALQDAAGSIKRSTGEARYQKLSDILDPNQLRAVESVRDDLARGARFEDLARAGAKGGPSAIDAATQSIESGFGGKVPNLLNRTAMVANAIIARLEGKLNAKLAAEIATDMLNPPAVAESMAQAQQRFVRNQNIARIVAQMRMPAIAGAAKVTE